VLLHQLFRFGSIASTGFLLTLTVASCTGEGDAPASLTALGQGGFTAGSNGVSAGQSSAGYGTGPSAAGNGVGGASGGAVSGSGGAGGKPEPCTDQQHPDHLDKDCSIWVEWDAQKGPGETKDCDASWLTGAGYCRETCGKCSPSSVGSTGGTGTAGNTGGAGGGPMGDPGPSLPNLTSGPEYWASRYWDCCKTHCATNAGAKSCGVDGVSTNNGNSACIGGSGYACYSEAPRAIGTQVSYGHVAVPNPGCNSCFHLQFTGTGQHNEADPGSKLIAGKHMIVKVSNTGGDVGGNQFDLMIPGGGVGLNRDTCPKQWGVSVDELGAVYGGFMSYPDHCYSGTHADRKACVRQKCSLIPAGDARDGCLWWVDWLELADNPNFRFEKIDCPSDI
jgi:Glycosyl hydrolase family 45